jgi:hypothetical protein
LDTRDKIVDVSEAAKQLSSGKWTVVPGLFDPLTATRARRLTGNGRKLAVIVFDSAKTLLSAEARAVLVAALRAVTLVVVAHPDQWRASVPTCGDVEIIEDPEEEAARSAEFIEFVIARHKSG